MSSNVSTAASARNASAMRPDDLQDLQDLQHLQHRYVTRGGLRLHLVEQGEANAPLVVLLHGFPEFWYSWRHQIGPLAAAGYHVVAVDQRGYNLSDKQGPYDLRTLTDDIARLIEALGYSQAAAVIGHDWGGAVTWSFGARYPELADRVAVCNVPHPLAVTKAFRSGYWPQIVRSWYIAFFQIPWLPEMILSANHYESLANTLRNTGHGTFSEADIALYREAWAQPMALPAMIGWYRALFGRSGARSDGTGNNLTVRRPALLIWGEDDFALTKQTAEWTRDYVPDLTIRYIPGASHWVEQERPDEVNRYLLDFLQAGRK